MTFDMAFDLQSYLLGLLVGANAVLIGLMLGTLNFKQRWRRIWSDE